MDPGGHDGYRSSLMRLGLALFLGCLLMLTASSSALAGGEDRGPTPSLTVVLEPNTREAKVTQSQADNVTFQGTATVDQSQVTTSVLTLTGVTSTGWPVSIDPAAFEVTGPSTVTFEVFVEVPPGTSSLMIGNVIVTSTLKVPLLSPISARVTVSVTVGQYYKARIEFEDPFIELERGEEGTTEGSVYNDGNGNARFRLSLVNVPDGIQATLSSSDFDVGGDDSHTFKVIVNVLEGADSDIHDVTIRAECMDSDGSVAITKEYPIFIRVRGLKDKVPGLGPGIVMTVIVLSCMVILLNPLSGWKGRHQ